MTMATSGAISPISADDFATIRSLLDLEAAIQIEVGQEYLVESRLKPVLRKLGLTSLDQLVDGIRRHDRRLIDETIDAMTTNETLFFRDQGPFDTLRSTILPPLLVEPRMTPITIWSAACSSGQEPYSLAMLLLEAFPQQAAAGRFRIIATDLSSTMIERCSAGRYAMHEVNRGLAPERLQRHFVADEQAWKVKPDVRSMIDFRQHNLLGSWAEIPRCDVVLMRNVLIYFTPEMKLRLVTRLERDVLVPGGALFLGASETLLSLDVAFESQHAAGSIHYRRL